MPTQNTSHTTPGYLARFGRAMRQHQREITVLQWCIVALYALLLTTPFFFSPPNSNDSIFTHPRLFSQFLFWGVGWPLIFLSMMFFGRAWCGLLCPDGTITECISRHGRKRSIPRWMRWPGWPCTMLVVTTLYGQLVSVYDLYWGTLLLLGLPTLGALWCGYSYSNGRRVWCMYLCPANGSFRLLAKIAPLHFHVDETKWKQYPPPLPRIDCPPLIDILRMQSNSACHMCGRCGGYLDAVELASRSPCNEILSHSRNTIRTADAVTLIFGLLGVCTMAIRWRESNLFAILQSALNHTALSTLEHTTAPWWILANHPADNHVYSLLDGVSIVLYILGGGILLGLLLLAFLTSATRIAAIPSLSWQKLSLTLIPLGGIGLFLGLTSFTVTLLRREGFDLTWVPVVQQILLFGGSIFSLWLGAKLLAPQRSPRHFFAWLCFATTVALMVFVWLEKLSS